MKLILISLLISTNCLALTFNNFLSEINYTSSTFGDINLKKSFKIKNKNSTHYIFNFYDSQNHYFDIDLQINVTKQQADTFTENQSNLLFMLYRDTPSPYAGVISNIEKCADKYKPSKSFFMIKNKKYTVFMSSAGNRFQYGACTEENVAYYVCTLFFYQSEKEIFHKLKYFVPVKEHSCIDGIKKYILGLSDK